MPSEANRTLQMDAARRTAEIEQLMLTGIGNRRLLNERLAEAIALADRARSAPVARNDAIVCRDAQTLRALSGVVPVTRSSGKQDLFLGDAPSLPASAPHGGLVKRSTAIECRNQMPCEAVVGKVRRFHIAQRRGDDCDEHAPPANRAAWHAQLLA